MTPEVGAIFGSWSVVEYLGKYHRNHRWLCRCKCGSESKIVSGFLTSGRRKRCKKCADLAKRLRPYESLFNSVRHNAEREEHDWEFSYEDFLSFCASSVCHYCWRPVFFAEYSLRENSNYASNLDRKDSSLGYIPGNVVRLLRPMQQRQRCQIHL